LHTDLGTDMNILLHKLEKEVLNFLIIEDT